MYENLLFLHLRILNEEISTTTTAVNLLLNQALEDIKLVTKAADGYFSEMRAAHLEGKIFVKEPFSVPVPMYIAILRVLLPSIEFLGQCLEKMSTHENAAVNFMTTYMSKINPKYTENSARKLWKTYRVGVIHNGNIVRVKNKNVITNDDVTFGYGECDHLKMDDGKIVLGLAYMIKELNESFELYKKDLVMNVKLTRNIIAYMDPLQNWNTVKP